MGCKTGRMSVRASALRWAVVAAFGLLAACGPATPPSTAVSAAGSAPVVAPPSYAVAVPVPPRQRTSPVPAGLQSQITALTRGFQGKVGVSIRAVDAGWSLTAGSEDRLAQQSVSKLWVAMTVLDARDQGKLRLDDPVTITDADLTLFHQPIAGMLKDGSYTTTVGNLLFQALTRSDNTANDRLLWLVGGPPAVRDFLGRKALFGIGFGPGERLLQSGTAGLTWTQTMAKGGGFEAARSRLSMDTRLAAFERYVASPPDGASARGIADALSKLARGEVLSETSTRLLLTTMGESITGRARMRAALLPGWQIAHKTGTGQELGARNAGFNDVGLLTAPDGSRYAVAVMIGDTTRPMRERQQLIQAVASALTSYGQTLAANRGASAGL